MGLAQYDYDDEELGYLAEIEEELQERADQQAYKNQSLRQLRKDENANTHNEFNVHDAKILNSKHFCTFYRVVSTKQKLKKVCWLNPSIHVTHSYITHKTPYKAPEDYPDFDRDQIESWLTIEGEHHPPPFSSWGLPDEYK